MSRAKPAQRPAGIRLNLGCGHHILPGWVNVDHVALPGVDVVADLDRPWPWRDGEASMVHASHVFEHVADPVLFMRESWRVLAPGGELDIRVPWYRHWHAFTDPTHRRFCTEHTFDYWIAGEYLHQKFGAGFGSPPAVFSLIRRTPNNGCEIQVRLEKRAS